MYVRCLDKVKSTIIDDKFDKVLENNKAIKKLILRVSIFVV